MADEGIKEVSTERNNTVLDNVDSLAGDDGFKEVSNDNTVNTNNSIGPVATTESSNSIGPVADNDTANQETPSAMKAVYCCFNNRYSNYNVDGEKVKSKSY